MSVVGWLDAARKVNRVATAVEGAAGVLGAVAVPARGALFVHDCVSMGKEALALLSSGPDDYVYLEDGTLCELEDGTVVLLDENDTVCGVWDGFNEEWST